MVSNRKTVPLVSLPQRITQLQFDRLRVIREHDGIAVRDHVRRAIDEYLDRIEKKYERRSSPPPGDISPPPAVPTGANDTAEVGSRQVRPSNQVRYR